MKKMNAKAVRAAAMAVLWALVTAPSLVTHAFEIGVSFTAAERTECASDSKEAERQCLQGKAGQHLANVLPGYAIVWFFWQDDPPEAYVWLRRGVPGERP